MPELPELEVIKEHLLSELTGKRIDRFRILKPYALKNLFDDDLHDEEIRAITRRGKYLMIHLDAFTIVLHLMLRGRVRTTDRCRMRKSLAAFIQFTDGICLELEEPGTQKMVKIYVYQKDDRIPHIERLGHEPLAPGFDARTLRSLLQRASCQLRSFLRSQKYIAGIGSAYADEILWMAKLSPFKHTASLEEQELARLLRAIKDVLRDAVVQVRRHGYSEKRDFLHIHGKKDMPCPHCGTRILTVSFSRGDVYYCPDCQTRGRKLKDRRMSKFYRKG
ncbi:MAG: Fpg/Nei family DNA glycosylase [candidate division WOR-3 bacterium]|nr:MAG: Fpg/Nei family DNA glycosylase [candidate division WOR-3 bacterium]